MGEALAHPLVLLFAGVFALLAGATVIGRRLAAAGARGDPERAAMLTNLNDRILSWWVIVGVLALAFLAGTFATILLFALVSFWCLREFTSLTPTPVADHYALAAAFYVFLPLQYLLLWDAWLNLFTILIPVYGYLLLPAIAVLWGETRDFLLRISKVQWALMLAVYCLSHVPAVLILHIPGAPAGSFGLLAFLLIVVQGSDVAQYVFGKSFGRRKIAPRVSPSKTWEGFVGGGATAALLGAGLCWLTPFSALQALGMAFAVVLAGFAGGLVLSAVKRSLGAKDWGCMVEGHGGMLDRRDSLACAAPIFFHLTNYDFAV
jgi:phosphatidate cytidylyltransferase